jgi:Tol biopolymer transport system component
VKDASGPVFSPDGQTIYFARTTGRLRDSGHVIERKKKNSIGYLLKLPTTSIWAVQVDGSGLRRITPRSRAVSDYPGSVSPLTGDLAFTRIACHRRCHNSIHLFSPVTGAETPLVAAAVDPAFSPDGLHLAYASYRDHNWASRRPAPPATELYVQDLTTASTLRLSHTRDVDETTPSWDPSGQRLAYARGRLSSRVFEINPDGSCALPVTPKPHHGGLNLGPLISGVAWQPGPGREAGPIAC